MIDAVKIGTSQNQAGKEFERVTLWVGGVPFSADLTPHVERIARRIASDIGVEIQDRRPPVAGRDTSPKPHNPKGSSS